MEVEPTLKKAKNEETTNGGNTSGNNDNTNGNSNSGDEVMLQCLNQAYQDNRNFNCTYKCFYIIKDAVKVSDANGNIPIYSLDKTNPKNPGAKTFYASGYETFWHNYIGLPDYERCFYETLLPDQLCHLYADIEGYRLTNNSIDFVATYELLVSELRTFLQHHLNVTGPVRVVELDSSTAKKFSKHCVFKIEGCYFRNNYHCGAFMRQFQKYLIEKYGLDSVFWILPEKESPQKVFIMDLGVYTLRRQFRLLGSSKRVMPRSALTINNRALSRADFFDCLIQYVPNTSLVKRVLYVREPDGSEPTSCSLRTFDDEGLPVSIAQQPRTPIGKGQQQMSPGHPGSTNRKRALSGELQQILTKYFKTTYDYEITSYTVGTDVIKLDTYDTRCMNKLKMTGIPTHKSNHVYFVVRPSTKHHFQACYDDDTCKKCITLLGKGGQIVDGTVIRALNDYWIPKNNTFSDIDDC